MRNPSNGPDPSTLVQHVMKTGVMKEQWLAHAAIQRAYNAASHAKRKAMQPLVDQADLLMVTLERREQVRIEGRAA